jgi:hypothetical protein
MAEDVAEHQVSVPAARSRDLVSREADGELLLYDTTRQRVHRLNNCAANVWAMCDGRRTVSDIVRQMRDIQPSPVVTEETVQEAIGKLADAELLVATPIDALRVPSPSRRNLLKNAALAAGALAVPAVISLSVPKTGFAQGIVEGGLCDQNHSCPDMMVCCHRPGYVQGDRCWSDPNLCVM